MDDPLLITCIRCGGTVRDPLDGVRCIACAGTGKMTEAQHNLWRRWGAKRHPNYQREADAAQSWFEEIMKGYKRAL